MFKYLDKIAIVGVLVAIAVVSVVLFAKSGNDDSKSSSGQSSPSQPQMRDVTVYQGKEPAPSASSNHMRAQLLDGPMPKSETVATVLTDENCEPDSAGVSHCRNKMKLKGGKKLSLRHPHAMMKVACLSPGESVHIKPA